MMACAANHFEKQEGVGCHRRAGMHLGNWAGNLSGHIDRLNHFETIRASNVDSALVAVADAVTLSS